MAKNYRVEETFAAAAEYRGLRGARVDPSLYMSIRIVVASRYIYTKSMLKNKASTGA